MKNKKVIFLLTLITLLVVVLIWFYLGYWAQSGKKSGQVVIDNQIINVEIARTASEQSKGLGDRISLPTNSGMLFVFPDKKTPSFWMKDMHFSLDFIWISDDKIVDITPNVPAPANAQSPLPIYQPQAKVNYVLEVNAGFCEKNNIKTGDNVVIKY